MSPPLRVLLVLDSLAPGGAEHSTVAILPFLIERGIQPEVAVLHDRPGLSAEVVGLGVPLHDLSYQHTRVGWILALHDLIRDRSPHVVHTSLFDADICGRIAAFVCRTPVVSTLPTERYGPDQIEDDSIPRLRLRLAQTLDACTARLTTRLHAVSHHVAKTMSRNLAYPDSRIEVVHRGRQRSLMSTVDDRTQSAVRLQLGIGDRPLVLAIGRHERPKGLDRLLEAFATVHEQVPDAVLVIAGGTGKATNLLESIIERTGLGDSVHLLGYRTDTKVLLAAAQVFVLPSRREGLPGVLLEAMAVGCPAVASDLPQVKEVVSDAEALLVNAAEPDELASAILDVLGDPRSAHERSVLAQRRFSERFTISRSADEMFEFYHRALVKSAVRSGRPEL